MSGTADLKFWGCRMLDRWRGLCMDRCSCRALSRGRGRRSSMWAMLIASFVFWRYLGRRRGRWRGRVTRTYCHECGPPRSNASRISTSNDNVVKHNLFMVSIIFRHNMRLEEVLDAAVTGHDVPQWEQCKVEMALLVKKVSRPSEDA